MKNSNPGRRNFVESVRKYTLLRDRLNYKSTKMSEKGEEENFGIFHVVFSTIKGGKKGGAIGERQGAY